MADDINPDDLEIADELIAERRSAEPDEKLADDMLPWMAKTMTFIGSYTPVDLRATLNKLYSGALGDLGWIEQRPLSAGGEAFSELLQGSCPAPKIVLQTG
jgi:hypothetical protein